MQTHVAMLEQMHREAQCAAQCAKENAAERRRRRRMSSVQSSAGRPSRHAAAQEVTATESYTSPPELRGHVDALAEMGFQLTLCQKAVGKYGADMEAAVAWLTSGQAQEDQRQLARSPSWRQAEELAQAMGAFSVAACKAALDKSGKDANAAAMWLLEQGSELEAQLAAEAQAEDNAALASNETIDDDDEGGDLAIRTVSFHPVAGGVPLSHAPSFPRQMGRSDSTRDGAAEGKISFDEFISAAPPAPPVLPDEDPLLNAAPAQAAQAALLQRRASQLPGMPPLTVEECLAGRLIRPTPLAANRNCVLASADGEGLAQLCTRQPETDVMHVANRHLTQCQRAEVIMVCVVSNARV